MNAGSRLGPYEIVSRIGAGGMGEVYKARDTRLDRVVAVKMLPVELAGDAQMRIRFEREAKTISQLEHPNICRLYDVGDDYLVMELLDGESLADRLASGPMPIEEVLRYGSQIAEALARAHRAGVVHRDLKPGNIMITKSGAKLLDFGLAKSSVIDLPSDGATMQKPLTREGTILGTFQYMSPEQLEGLEADARSDIFALGAVLYEMATGARAFDGKTKTSLIAAIVKEQPRAIAELRPVTPPALEHVVMKCLSKEPDDRWQSAHDVAEELRWAGQVSAASAPPPIPTQRLRHWPYWVALAALCGVIAMSAALLVRERRLAQRPVTLPIAPPRGAYFNAIGNESGAAVLSPDGRLIVFSAAVHPRAPSLWVQSVESGRARELPSTAGGKFPFWSPDSKSVGFFANTKLQRIDVSGGAPIPICDASNARGGAWGANGTIVFTPSTVAPIYRVSANGGTPVPVTKLGGGFTTHRWPQFLPDGHRFIYLAATHQAASTALNTIMLGSTDGKENRVVVKSPTSGFYVDGHLLFARDGTLYAWKLNDQLTPEEDEPSTVLRGAIVDDAVWRSPVSAAEDGTLLYHTGSSSPRSRLTWVDRTGKTLGTIGEPDIYLDARLSPDNEKILIGIGDPIRQLWIHDLRRNVRTRFTVTAEWSGSASWSPDGTTIYYVALQNGQWKVLAAPSTGGRSARVLASLGANNIRTTGVSPDGKFLLVDVDNNVEIMPSSGGELKRVFPDGLTKAGSFSPDGRWIAYVSNENGSRAEVFIASRAEPSVKWQVSVDGGDGPQWSDDGTELFYQMNSGRTVMSVPIDGRGNEPQIGRPQELFSAPVKQGFTDFPFAVAKDKNSFLVNLDDTSDTPGLMFVRDWRNDTAAQR